MWLLYHYILAAVKDDTIDKSPSSSKDEFDMFAQSRNVTYETTKTG